MLHKNSSLHLNDNDFDFLKHNQNLFIENKIYKNFVALLKQAKSSVEDQEFDRLKNSAIKSSENLRDRLMKESNSTQEVVNFLKISRQAVLNRIKQNKIIAFKVNKNYFFPKWQFNPNSSSGIYNGIHEILKAFPKTISEIEIVNWFSRNSEGQEIKRYEMLRNGKNMTILIKEAEYLGVICG